VLEVDWDGDQVLVGMDVLVDEGGGNRTGTVECIRGKGRAVVFGCSLRFETSEISKSKCLW
jgi:hypothetical protein